MLEQVKRHAPCSVCGLETFRHKGWFLVEEDYWQNRLRVLSWHPTLAIHADTADVKSVCCREHLKTMVEGWLFRAWARPAPSKLRGLHNLDASAEGAPLGELIVDRESFSTIWAGSPACLESVLDALLLIGSEHPHDSLEVHLSGLPPSALAAAAGSSRG